MKSDQSNEQDDNNEFLRNAPAAGSRHKVKCIDYELGWTKDNAEQLGLALEVIDGPHAGFHSILFLSFTPDAREYSIQKMRALGWAGDDFQKLGTLKNDLAMATFEREEYEGKLRVRVGWINPLGVQMKKPMDSDEINRFAAKMKAAIGSGGNHARHAMPDDRDVPPPNEPPAGYR